MQEILSHRVRHRSGFSLVEILVVITILGVLASITYGVSLKLQTSAQAMQAKSMADQTAAACERFYGEYGYYPPKNGTLSNFHGDTFFSLEDMSVMFISALTGEDSIHNTKSQPSHRLINF